MASKYSVKPEMITKPLQWIAPDGEIVDFTIKIKKFLNVGESRNVQTAGWRGVKQAGGNTNDTEISIDWKGMTFARVAEYLLDWSLEDEKGQRMPPSISTLQSLHEDLYELIEKAITDHVAEIEQEKKARTGLTAPTLTSV
jgi:hypothetical protein